jgi:hypothetical protein
MICCHPGTFRATRPACALLALIALTLLADPRAVFARQMDPRAVAGIPLPVADIPVGTVVVRVIKGSLTNNIPGQQVELTGAGAPRTATTDAGGRAEFSGLPPGARVTATATVGGERLQSQEFAVPGSGGVRLILFASDPASGGAPAATPPAQAAQPGSVVLGDQSRFVIELGDGSLSVFNLMQIVNASPGPVMPPQPIVFELPDRATQATILKESSPQATAAGTRVTVVGPFAPGSTNVQFAYSMPYSTGSLTIEQAMPLPLGRVIVLAQKVGDTHMTSAQLSEHREMPADGQMYIVGQGPALRAGERVALAFTGLPHESWWPRYVAIALAVAILGAGWWASRNRATTLTSAQARLEKRRSHLFEELTALEEQHRAGAIEAHAYAARRGELVTALERVYAEIDRQAA